jgi:AcrR family transcriptional regulator
VTLAVSGASARGVTHPEPGAGRADDPTDTADPTADADPAAGAEPPAVEADSMADPDPAADADPTADSDPVADAADPGCAPARRPGRPRERRTDRAITGSALEIFAEDGFHALTIEAVAARAGVGKTTIYRRWPGKKELVIDALATINDELMAAKAQLPVAAADRIRAVLHHLTTRDNDSLLGRITPRMLVYSESLPDLYAEYFDRVIMPRRRWLHGLLQEGVDRGELRADLDIEVAALALVGPALMPARGLGLDEDPADLADRLFDLLWPAFRPTAEPGRPGCGEPNPGVTGPHRPVAIPL